MRLGVRLGSAAVLLAILVAALVLRGAVFDVLAGLTLCVAAWELSGLLRRMGAPPPAWVLYPLMLWLLLRHRYPSDWHVLDWGLGVAVVAGLLSMLARPRDLLDRGLLRWAGAVGGALYLGLTVGYLLIMANAVGGFGVEAFFSRGSGQPLILVNSSHQHAGQWLVAIALGSAMVGDTVRSSWAAPSGTRPSSAASRRASRWRGRSRGRPGR